MPDSTTAGIVAAVASVGTVLALIINALAAWRQAGRLERKVDVVHNLVNQQQTDLKNYQRALIRALQAAGIAVPEDQSAPEADGK